MIVQGAIEPDSSANTVLIVDADTQNEAHLLAGIKSVLGEHFSYCTTHTVTQANEFIFDHMMQFGNLPFLVLTDFWVPSGQGALVDYANQLARSYPEIPIILYTKLFKEKAIGDLKSTVNLLGYLQKPWSDDTHPLLLAKLIAKAVH